MHKIILFYVSLLRHQITITENIFYNYFYFLLLA
jgi:hypothetical protein